MVGSITKAKEYKMLSVFLETGGKKRNYLTPLLGNFGLELGKLFVRSQAM